MLCKTCNRYAAETVSNNCAFCRHLQFPENIICEITRGSQEKRNKFTCSAFRQKLSLAGHEKRKAEAATDESVPLLTEKQKYDLAKALQQLKGNPDDPAYNLKYHLCFAVRKREPLFIEPDPYIARIVACFEQMEAEIPGIIRSELLWLAPDHIHAYLEATPDHAVDRIATGMRKKLAELSRSGQGKKYIWNKFYFSGTIG